MNLTGRLRAAWSVVRKRSLTQEQFEDLGLLGLNAPVPRVAAGVSVTQQSALGISAFWCGIGVIAGDVGLLDRFLYRKTGEDTRERATTHPAYRVVHDSPNPHMTPLVFWENLTSHAVAWGNGYAEIEWDNAMRPIALWPIPPNMIEPKIEVLVDGSGRKHSRLYYLYNGTEAIDFEDVIHVPGRSFNGIKGYSVVEIARQSLGLALATERYGASFFGEGAWPGLALTLDGELSEPAQQRLRKQIEERHQGPGKAHRLIVLEQGMKVSKPLTIPPDDAQFLQTRETQIDEMARWLDLPPSKLKHRMGERPGGNLEASQLDYLTGSLLRWTTRIEQELARKLIAPRDRTVYYFEHEFKKLLKVDADTRSRIQERYLRMRVITPQQIARQENLPDPPAATEPPLDLPPEPPPPPTPPERDADQLAAYRDLVASVVRRYVQREGERVRQASRKGDAASFGEWTATFYGRELDVLEEVLQPLLESGSRMFRTSAAHPGPVAADYLARSRDDLLSLPRKGLAAAAERLTNRWEAARVAELTDAVLASLALEG